MANPLAQLLSTAGNYLAMPGDYTRGLLTGRPGERVRAEELIRILGLADDPGLLATLGMDVVTDPLSWLAVGGAAGGRMAAKRAAEARRVRNATPAISMTTKAQRAKDPGVDAAAWWNTQEQLGRASPEVLEMARSAPGEVFSEKAGYYGLWDPGMEPISRTGQLWAQQGKPIPRFKDLGYLGAEFTEDWIRQSDELIRPELKDEMLREVFGLKGRAVKKPRLQMETETKLDPAEMGRALPEARASEALTRKKPLPVDADPVWFDTSMGYKRGDAPEVLFNRNYMKTSGLRRHLDEIVSQGYHPLDPNRPLTAFEREMVGIGSHEAMHLANLLHKKRFPSGNQPSLPGKAFPAKGISAADSVYLQRMDPQALQALEDMLAQHYPGAQTQWQQYLAEPDELQAMAMGARGQMSVEPNIQLKPGDRLLPEDLTEFRVPKNRLHAEMMDAPWPNRGVLSDEQVADLLNYLKLFLPPAALGGAYGASKYMNQSNAA